VNSYGTLLIWAWRDEEMHTIYIRGALLKVGNRLLRWKTFGQQLGGLVGGWAGSVRQHVLWSSAPVSCAIATGVTWLGALTGKVPDGVRQHLNYGPFRDFCLFNVDAEKTASLCYERMIVLAEKTPEVGRELAEDFVRVREDEDRHAHIFEIIAETLDEQNQQVAHENEGTLAEKITEVGEYFLPRGRRQKTVSQNKIGKGARVFVFHGEHAEEKCSVFRQLLEQSGLAERLERRTAELKKNAAELRIIIKPSFMLGYHLKDRSIITDRELLHELGKFLREHGYGKAVLVPSRGAPAAPQTRIRRKLLAPMRTLRLAHCGELRFAPPRADGITLLNRQRTNFAKLASVNKRGPPTSTLLPSTSALAPRPGRPRNSWLTMGSRFGAWLRR